MTNNSEPNPIKNLVELVQRILADFKSLIRDHKWFNLSLYLSAILFLLFTPEKGWFSPSIANIITDAQYNTIFWIIFFLVFAIGIFLEVSQLISRSENWIKLLLRIFLIGLILFTINKLFWSPTGNIPNGIDGTFSYGRESLFSKRSPETKIYQQNKKVLLDIRKPLKIVVTVPISTPNGSFYSDEFLRGVAIAQDEWNKIQAKDDKNLQVLIGIADDGYTYNDNNIRDSETNKFIKSAKSITEKLIKEKDILAVIGTMGSDATEATAPTYEQGKLVLVSSTSTAKREDKKPCDLDNIEERDSICLNEYIFRTAIDDLNASGLLVSKIIEKNKLPNNKKIQTIAIAFDSKSIYSSSFKSAFQEKFEFENGKILIDNQCDFAKESYQGKNCMDSIQQKNADAILLIPGNFVTTDKVESIIAENFQSEDKHLFLLGSDTMYKQSFVVKNRYKRNDTEGMLIPIVWHRSVVDECIDQSELECKASKIFPNLETEENKPLGINWRTATAYESTKAILEGLKIAKKEYCGGLLNFTNLNDYDCMREKLKDVLRSPKFNESNFEGAKAGTSIIFENGDRKMSGNVGVVVEARDGNFHRFFP